MSKRPNFLFILADDLVRMAHALGIVAIILTHSAGLQRYRMLWRRDRHAEHRRPRQRWRPNAQPSYRRGLLPHAGNDLIRHRRSPGRARRPH